MGEFVRVEFTTLRNLRRVLTECVEGIDAIGIDVSVCMPDSPVDCARATAAVQRAYRNTGQSLAPLAARSESTERGYAETDDDFGLALRNAAVPGW
ncbi:hypothetical protein [Aldersonia kunmingensis]|uniref:hypothetical protein n=1 Tax=Aldersonia kunmingensis TaxID=408066 RepID=UPI000835F280|nr:hypothetical protein [Aldersonia kunmingensis]